MSKKQGYGWVIEDTVYKAYLCHILNADNLRGATVYLTRKEARKIKSDFCLSGDIIRRVSLDCGGRAIAIIPGR